MFCIRVEILITTVFYNIRSNFYFKKYILYKIHVNLLTKYPKVKLKILFTTDTREYIKIVEL